ncbi:Hypothetical predicted protein [Cloeon dipterum]|uniref:Uncharacterized protein n=1 Tax=Cloeon dipterum TaxID=197152 RepID=A0A8S1DLA9_9INSE|nr:Hypothetical predicted protein [Cloeon dipterum]
MAVAVKSRRKDPPLFFYAHALAIWRVASFRFSFSFFLKFSFSFFSFSIPVRIDLAEMTEQRAFVNQRRIEFLEPDAEGNFTSRNYPTLSDRGNSILAIAAEEDDAEAYYPSVFCVTPNRSNFNNKQASSSKSLAFPLNKRERFERLYAQSRASEGLFQCGNNQASFPPSSRQAKQPCVVFEDPSANMALLYQTNRGPTRSSVTPRALNFEGYDTVTHEETTPRKRQIQVESSAANAPSKPKILKETSRQSSDKCKATFDIKSKVKKASGSAEVVILTANVKCTVEWHSQISSFRKFHVLFEVFAILQRVRETEMYYELLLRDKSGPLMLTLFYKMDQTLPELARGQVVRVVGRLLARTRLQAFSVRQARPGEMQRHDLYLSNQSLKTMKRIEQDQEE